MLEKLALKNVMGNGISVIGRYQGRPNYIQDAQDIGHSYFNVEESVWKRLSGPQKDYANMHFIDTQAAKRDVFLTSTPGQKIEPNSALSREVQRLIEVHGYTWSADGFRLEPPKRK